MRALLRLPTPGFPSEAATGDPTVDGFLERADRRLTGSRRIRAPYVAELSDHLWSIRDREVGRGLSPQEAARFAVEQCGDLRTWARSQRAARRRMFLVAGVTACVSNGFLLAILLILVEVPGSIPFWAATTIISGVLMGYAFGYVVGPPGLAAGIPASGEQEEFLVVHEPWVRASAVLLMLGFVAGGSISLAGGVGWGLFSDLPWPAGAFVFLVSIVGLLQLGPAAVRIRVDAEGVEYRSLLRTSVIGWQQIIEVRKEDSLVSFIRPPFGRKLRLRWQPASNGSRELFLAVDAGMPNMDRMVAVLMDHAPQG